MYQLFVYCYDRTPRRKATQERESLFRLMVPEGESVHDGGAKAWPQTTSMAAGKDDRGLTSGIKSKMQRARKHHSIITHLQWDAPSGKATPPKPSQTVVSTDTTDPVLKDPSLWGAFLIHTTHTTTIWISNVITIIIYFLIAATELPERHMLLL